MEDIAEMKDGIVHANAYRVLLLIDRVAGFSNDASVLGSNFTGTRLYELKGGTATPLAGHEYFPEIGGAKDFDANMGDARVLRDFIRYGKKYYRAKHYALFFYSHGDGISFCPDVESDHDALFPAEVSDVLGKQESVDLVGLDVCSMAGVEVAYQWRPSTTHFSTSYLIASAPISVPWNYYSFFSNLAGHSSDITAGEMAQRLFDEVRKSQQWCSWALLDLTKVALVKETIDRWVVAKDPASRMKSLIAAQSSTLNYTPVLDPTSRNYYEMRMPFFDIYDLIERTSDETDFAAKAVLEAIDAFVIDSFDGSRRNNAFRAGAHGVYIFFPYVSTAQWPSQTFYSPFRQKRPDGYGGLSWCSDASIIGNGIVENWFELLVYHFGSRVNLSGRESY